MLEDMMMFAHGRWIPMVIVGMLLWLIGWAPSGWAPTDAAVVTPPTGASSDTLTFTSGGQALLFNPQGITISNGRYALRVTFDGATAVAPHAAPESTHGGTGAPPLTWVTYANLWEGISLTYDRGGGIVRSTYHLAPGADPDRIRLTYNRAVGMQPDGSLRIAFDSVVVQESAPVAWQDLPGGRVAVAVRFVRVDERTLGFAVGAYDPAYPLTIDPTLTIAWNTFLGGSGDDGGYALAVDGSGNVYVGGSSASTWGDPKQGHSGSSDAFVAKLNSSGALVWHTFLGGSGDDGGTALAVDGSGNVYVGGRSGATWGSPKREHSGNDDAFVAKVASDGTLVWHTFLGGSWYDSGTALAVDGSGNVYVGGWSEGTWGSPLRVFSGGYDAFVAKVASDDGTLGWNTFLGGSGNDFGAAIAVDGSGNVYVGGSSDGSWGSPLRGYSGGPDAFVAKVASDDGTLGWNTFLGGNWYDYGTAIAVDASGNVYVSGWSGATWGSPWRVFSGNYDAFVAQLGSSGNLVWNTFLGGSADDFGAAIAVDVSRNLYVGGRSGATWGSPLRPYASEFDAFVAKLPFTIFLPLVQR
jgi:hypothetical protein